MSVIYVCDRCKGRSEPRLNASCPDDWDEHGYRRKSFHLCEQCKGVVGESLIKNAVKNAIERTLLCDRSSNS